MKKLTFLVYHKEYDEFLTQLRELGVVHIVTRQSGEMDASLQAMLQNLTSYKNLLNDMLLAGHVVEAQSEGEAQTLEPKAIQAQYEDFQKQQQQINQQLITVDKEMAQLSVWGDFNWEPIHKLQQLGWAMNFFTCPEAAFDESWVEAYNAIRINSVNGRAYFITLSNDTPMIDAEQLKLPAENLSQLAAKKEKLQHNLQQVIAANEAFCKDNYSTIDTYCLQLQQELELERVRLNGEPMAEGAVMLLQGWIPEKCTDDLKAYLDKTGQFYEIDNPTPEDDIPIQLSNNRFFRLFEPLTRLYMLPTYGELDLTKFFAPFFMLFFGLCLGDMGYGLLMIVALPIFTKLFQLINPDFKPSLVVLFGLSTMLCGTLTGTAFGFNIYEIDIPFFQNMKQLLFQDNQMMFMLSLIIGCVQILFGMVIKAVNQTIQLGFKYAVSTIGWFILLVSTAVAYLYNGFDNIIYTVVMILSAAMIFLYNSPGKNIFLNIGLGLWDSYNMATGLLGDVLSYVRLFALGLSGGILAGVFNSLAVGMSPDVPVLGFIITALIFLVGHAINIFMNILGAMVHPMRLTFVEFFKNAGFEGGGHEYKPFQTIKK